jgi:hypothetical protein
MSFILTRSRILYCLLFLALLLPQVPVSTATAQGIRSTPVLSYAATVTLPASTVTVAGEGFTPGGPVTIAVYDRWGVDAYEHVWTTAAEGTEGDSGSQNSTPGHIPAGAIDEVIALFPVAVGETNGSQDPDQDFVPGVHEPIIGVTCGRDLMVRAYDQRTATWSNVLDVTASC